MDTGFRRYDELIRGALAGQPRCFIVLAVVARTLSPRGTVTGGWGRLQPENHEYTSIVTG